MTLNSLDAVSDRDYVLEFLAAAAIIGMHLSRLAADLTLWATAEFGFVEIADGFATGSSIMPQKKNPDVAELIRGKSGRLYGNLMAVLTIMKGLPLTYNADMQEDKEPLFDSVDTLEAMLTVLPPMLATLTFRPERMRRAAGEHRNGHRPRRLPRPQGPALPPRSTRSSGASCATASRRGGTFFELPVESLRRFSDLIDDDVKDAMSVEASLRARAVTGGTAPDAVRASLAVARALVGEG